MNPERSRARTSRSANPTALITGASSGIGEALACRFARGGFNVVLVARRFDRLQRLAGLIAKSYPVKAWVAAADLAQPDGPKKLASSMRRARRPIDVLVNNAGMLEHGAFVSIPAARHQQVIDLNISAFTAMLAEFVPGMVARGHGRVLNVASIAAFQPVPTLTTYAATKAYVLSLTESLAEEMDGTDVTFTALCPGFTSTNMLDSARRKSRELQELPRLLVGAADSVAEDGYRACLRGELICVPGVLNRAANLTSRATPRWLVRRFTGAMSRRLSKR